ncbi:MAG: hypothetical protein AB1Z98_24750, partial [Nannocystaceae bacterium]
MLKKVAIAVGVLLLLGAGVLAWLWQQATALPQWYTDGSMEELAGEPEADDGPVASPQWIAFDEQGERLPEAEPLPPATAPT